MIPSQTVAQILWAGRAPGLGLKLPPCSHLTIQVIQIALTALDSQTGLSHQAIRIALISLSNQSHPRPRSTLTALAPQIAPIGLVPFPCPPMNPVNQTQRLQFNFPRSFLNYLPTQLSRTEPRYRLVGFFALRPQNYQIATPHLLIFQTASQSPILCHFGQTGWASSEIELMK